MNLLIALMTTTFEQVYSQARTESAFAMAETTYDLSHRSRFMPAPICIYIFAIAAIVHYSATFCCCFVGKTYKYKLHHSGCYSCIPTELGAKEVNKSRSSCNGITLNQYAEEYELRYHFALDPQDTVLLKHLTVDTLFCKYCYRPF
eukprot:42501_1